MIKILFVLCSTVFIGNGCDSTKRSDDDRKELITKAVNAIARYDSLQLYKLIDTSYCFDIYGKDGFLYKVGYAFNRFKVCGKTIADNSIIVNEKQVGAKEYILPYCRNKRGEVINDSFDLVFSFAGYQRDGKILFMDVTIYRPVKSTVPVPKKGN